MWMSLRATVSGRGSVSCTNEVVSGRELNTIVVAFFRLDQYSDT